MMQAFEWYVAADGKHFRRLARDISALKSLVSLRSGSLLRARAVVLTTTVTGFMVWSISPNMADDKIYGIWESMIRRERQGRNGEVMKI